MWQATQTFNTQLQNCPAYSLVAFLTQHNLNLITSVLMWMRVGGGNAKKMQQNSVYSKFEALALRSTNHSCKQKQASIYGPPPKHPDIKSTFFFMNFPMEGLRGSSTMASMQVQNWILQIILSIYIAQYFTSPTGFWVLICLHKLQQEIF